MSLRFSRSAAQLLQIEDAVLVDVDENRSYPPRARSPTSSETP